MRNSNEFIKQMQLFAFLINEIPYNLKFKDKEQYYVLCTSPNAEKIGGLMKTREEENNF